MPIGSATTGPAAKMIEIRRIARALIGPSGFSTGHGTD